MVDQEVWVNCIESPIIFVLSICLRFSSVHAGLFAFDIESVSHFSVNLVPGGLKIRASVTQTQTPACCISPWHKRRSRAPGKCHSCATDKLPSRRGAQEKGTLTGQESVLNTSKDALGECNGTVLRGPYDDLTMRSERKGSGPLSSTRPHRECKFRDMSLSSSRNTSPQSLLLNRDLHLHMLRIRSHTQRARGTQW